MSKLHKVNVRILRNAISSGISGRQDLQFLPLFNFAYADGHQMLTIGGMLGGESERRAIDACDFGDAIYLRRSLDADEYEVPKVVLTRKEKLYLDAAMPRKKRWKPKDFEMEEKDLAAYDEVHRFFPSYAELFL